MDRIPAILQNSPFEDVRLIVVTDNERILGLGDQGAGGMGIPIGKLALYSATSGIHPSLTLPVSLDVGTDNRGLLDDPLYVGYRSRRLRGKAYDELVEAFVQGVAQTWPGCIIQWEDFKGPNALRILDRFRERIPSFNDDVQGTAAVTVAGIYAASRLLGRPITDLRFVLAGAGAAGVGITRLLRLALEQEGLEAEQIDAAITLLDSHGLVHLGRSDLDEFKQEVAVPAIGVERLGAAAEPADGHRLADVIRAVRPDVLIGATGKPGSFDEEVIRTMAAATKRPVVFALSNPSSRVEAEPADVLAWSDGRAIIATGSPFSPVAMEGEEHIVSQANNVFIFPGMGLGAMAVEASTITEQMFFVAARALASLVTDERLAQDALYPPVQALGEIARSIALAVASEAVRSGVAGVPADEDLARTIDEAMWTPDYVPYLKPRPTSEPSGA